MNFDSDMTFVNTVCRNFKSRSDISVFNMTNYCSCENCRHLTASGSCRFQGSNI